MRKVFFAGAAALLALGAALWIKHQKPEGVAWISAGTEAGSPTPQWTPTPRVLSEKLTPVDQQKVEILEQIFASKDDNDPRLDRDFKNLTPGLKFLLEKKYSTLSPEARNERGTIAFLIGREITSKEDLDFLSQVLNEPPCLSLENCNRETPVANGEDAHQESGLDVTLAYPQLITLDRFETYLSKPKEQQEPQRVSDILGLVRRAKESQVPAVANKASALLERFDGG